MYRIKAKEGYNIIINDIGIKLKSNAIDWTEIDEKLFDNSKDAKKLSSLIIKEEGCNKVSSKATKSNNVVEVQQDMFVRKGDTFATPKDVFVAHSETNTKNTEESNDTKTTIEDKKIESLNANDAPMLVADVADENNAIIEKTEISIEKNVNVVKDEVKKAGTNRKKNKK